MSGPTHRWTWARRGAAATFLVLLIAGNTPWCGWFRGTASATTVADTIPFVDPLAAAETALASRRLAPTVAVGAGLLLLAAVVAGPVFCGWVCPLGLVADLGQSARSGVRRRLRQRAPVVVARQASATPRVAVLLGVVAFAAASGVLAFQALSPINLLVRGVLFGSWAGLAVVVGLLALEWAFPRLWCRGVCPLGALYGIVGRRGRLRVHVHASCGPAPCRQCTRTCPMDIRVLEDHVLSGATWVDDPLCIRCGACADICPRDVLRLGLRGAGGSAQAMRRSPHGGGGTT
ncbi:MAG: 4Fe-4S binding protein [Planctomycetota bacterium]